MLRLFACVTQQHDPSIVAVAVIACLLACYTTANLMVRALAMRRLRTAWLLAAAAALGSGVWATHFIAMLAYVPASGLGYAVLPTVFSLVLAGVGSLATLVLSLRGRPNGWMVVLAGLLFGVTVAAMHIIGMMALRPLAAVAIAPAYAGAALAIGAALGVLALWAGRHGRLLTFAVLAALAVCGVHFTAMAGTIVQPLASLAGDDNALSGQLLAIGVASITLLALALGLVGAVMDRELASRTAKEARRLRRFADATFEGILFLRDGVVIDANAALCTLLGREREALLGRPVTALIGLPFTGMPVTGGATETELVDAEGRRRPVELLCRSLDQDTRQDRILVVRDLSDRKQAEQRIQHLAHHDSLTGLPNRTLFGDRLAHAVSMSERTGHNMALLCLDLDGFKAVNDLFGHTVADQVLVEVGNRLITCLRDSDTVARLGSDEFAIVQAFSEQPRGAAALAERVVRVLAEPFDIAGQHVCLGASVGIALFPSDARTPESLLRNADLALYRAKQDGRGLYRFFEQEMDERLQQRRTLEQELRGAMLRDELRLHYQPLLDSVTLEVEGVEALLRWPHPVRGSVSPAEFVPVAEESGLIAPLGHWVLETACAEAVSWTRPWRVAVNLSPAQFKQRDLAESIRAILDRTGLAPARLELEITEGILIDDAERALTMLREIKALGVRIALDDFGTGYSSLSYLRRFPFDKLKIDASFVQGLGDDGEADAIVRAIVALGRSLSLRITAEGVETTEQLQLLRKHRCDQVQGFLLGRPMPPAELATMRIPALAAAPA